MAMFATLQVVGTSANPPVITGQPISTILTVFNSGVAPVNMLSIQGFVLPITAGAIPDNEVIMPSQVQVPGIVGTTPGQQQYDLSFIITAPQIPGIISGPFTLAATCYSSDGSVFSAQAQVAATLAVNPGIGGQGGKGTAPFGFGELGFDLNFAPFLAGVFA
jgi:hypothetical protein